MTYEQAKANQWNVANHRIAYAREYEKPCKCADCREHMEAIEKGPSCQPQN